jgi:hypothetical protein
VVANAVGHMRDNRHSDRNSGDLVFHLLALLILTVGPLKAYADPGSGLLLWQIAGAFFVGSVYQIRRYFARLRKRK